MSVEPLLSPATAPVVPPSTASTNALPQTVIIPIDQLNAFAAMQARLAKVEEEQQRTTKLPESRTLKCLLQRVRLRRLSGRNVRRPSVSWRLNVRSARRSKSGLSDMPWRVNLPVHWPRSHLLLAVPSNSHSSGGTSLVEPQGSSFSVRTQDFRSVGDFISTQFSRPEYAHFLRAQNPSGGTGGGMATQMPHTTPPNPATDAQPKNMSEAVLLQMATMAKNTADPRLTPTVGMGLRPLTKQA